MVGRKAVLILPHWFVEAAEAQGFDYQAEADRLAKSAGFQGAAITVAPEFYTEESP